MLTIFSKGRGGYCDGFPRRNFLKIGAAGVGGLTLAGAFHSQTQAAASSSNKAVIHLFLQGGPNQMEIDLNLDAPSGVRTTFRPIASKVPGLKYCEYMPRMAAMAAKLAFLRTVYFPPGDHNSRSNMMGWSLQDPGALTAVGGRPSHGSMVAKLLGSLDGTAPAYASLYSNMTGGGPGFFGAGYGPFGAHNSGAVSSSMRLNGITLEQLQTRKHLLKSLNRLRSDIDNSGNLESFDTLTQKAINVVTSPKVADALDLNREDPKVVAQYSNPGWAAPNGRTFDGGVNLGLLKARRLIEAGVRYVVVGYTGWDQHQANDQILMGKLPILDHGVSTLVSDLEQRGMLDDVTVLVWGEMGRGRSDRKPLKDGTTGFVGGGTGHWDWGMSFMAGGGMQVGQAIGKMDRRGMTPADRPIHMREVHATVYRNLGIDPETKVPDPAGRPQYITDKPPLNELI